MGIHSIIPNVEKRRVGDGQGDTDSHFVVATLGCRFGQCC